MLFTIVLPEIYEFAANLQQKREDANGNALKRFVGVYINISRIYCRKRRVLYVEALLTAEG